MLRKGLVGYLWPSRELASHDRVQDLHLCRVVDRQLANQLADQLTSSLGSSRELVEGCLNGSMIADQDLQRISSR